MRDTIKCKHYRAMAEHKTCGSGVDYAGLGPASISTLPCFWRRRDSATPPTLCHLAEYPTEDEIAAEDAEHAAAFARVTKARAAIVNHLGGPWKKGVVGAGGSIDCPSCNGGILHFMRSGYNGHIHARCNTAGCVNWME